MKLHQLSVFCTLVFTVLSCVNESTSTHENDKTSDSLAVKENVQPPIQIGGEDTVLSMVFTTNNWVKNVEKTDTIQKEYLYVDDYDEKWPLTVYENNKGDFHFASLELKPEEPMRRVYFYFDENGELCQLNIIEIPKSFWRDENYKSWYMKNGNPFWYTEQHIYKDKYLVDTAYAATPFTTDEQIMFYTKDNIREIIKKNKSY